MKNLFFFLVFLANMGMAYASIPVLPFAILVDTAYVSNDLHIELAYRVLVPFGKIHLTVHTSMDDLDARQSTKAPLTLSGAAGVYKKRIPVNLPLDRVTEICILIEGVAFVNPSDSANYAGGIQKALFVKRQNREVVNYRTTYTDEESLAFEANLQHYRIYNSEGKLTDGWGKLIEVDDQGREIDEDTSIDRMRIYASDPLALNRDEIMDWKNAQPQEEGSTRTYKYFNISVSGNVNVTAYVTQPERISGCKVYMGSM